MTPLGRYRAHAVKTKDAHGYDFYCGSGFATQYEHRTNDTPLGVECTACVQALKGATINDN